MLCLFVKLFSVRLDDEWDAWSDSESRASRRVPERLQLHVDNHGPLWTHDTSQLHRVLYQRNRRKLYHRLPRGELWLLSINWSLTYEQIGINFLIAISFFLMIFRCDRS